jgi:hypothetical protein
MLSEPGQKMLRIERQEDEADERSTALRQKSRTLGCGLTLDDESALIGFGLGGPDKAGRGGHGLAVPGRASGASFGAMGGLHALTKATGTQLVPVMPVVPVQMVLEGRIAQWLGAFLVTIKYRSAFLSRPSVQR